MGQAAEQPHCQFPVPRKSSDNFHSRMTEYVACPNTFPASRQVPRYCRLHGHARYLSVSRIWFADLAVFPHIEACRWHRRVHVHNSRRSRYKRQGSLPPRFGRTGRFRRLPLSYPFVGFPIMFPPFRWPPRGC